MVSKKKYDSVDGSTSRFLSDFIIQSEQFARVYNYFYNAAGVEGDIDAGTGLPTRVEDFPNASEDLITLDKWDLADNSILFYTNPPATSSVWIEVATTPEEFGDTLAAPIIVQAEAARDAAELSEWEAEAEALTAESYATEAEDTFVNDVTSDGDGTFTYTPTTDYSSLHWAAKATAEVAPFLAHIADTSNPHSVTQAQVGLSNVDNTSDVNKPVSTAQQTALDLKANLASPPLTGTPTAPTASTETDTTQISTTAFVQQEITNRSQAGKNHIINGAFEINQYADIDTAPVAMSNGTFQIDRFYDLLGTITATIQRFADQTVNGNVVNTVKMVATSTATGSLGLNQKSENFYKGETKTFGVWVKSNTAEAYVQIWDGVSASSSSKHTGGGGWEFLTVTKTISVSATELRISIRTATVSITTGDYIESTMWQLERGSISTPFEQQKYGNVLAECHRFYRVITLFVNTSPVRSNAVIDMRVSPTVTGGGTGFVSSDTNADTLNCYQTTGASQALTLDAEI